jgi:hypothetical protein
MHCVTMLFCFGVTKQGCAVAFHPCGSIIAMGTQAGDVLIMSLTVRTAITQTGALVLLYSELPVASSLLAVLAVCM